MNASINQKNQIENVDGRLQRSQRSHQLISEAMLSLIQEGILIPTAQQVADRAQLGIRTVFRRFKDMESLFETIHSKEVWRQRRYFLDFDENLKIDKRISLLVKMHANTYQDMSSMIKATKAMMWRYKLLEKNYKQSQVDLRKHLRHYLPESLKLDEKAQQLIELSLSFESWDRLIELQGLSKKRSIEIIDYQVKKLFGLKA